MSADQPTRQHAVRSDANAQLATRRQNFRLDTARGERVLDLQIADRMYGMGTPQGRGAHLGQTDITHIPCLDHLADGTYRVLDRHLRIEPRRTVDVDVVNTEPLQRVGEEIL